MLTENQKAEDASLVHRAQAGELEAFEALVNRYEGKVFALARRITQQEQDAQDVTQQALISALEHLEGFRAEASFSTWLMRIATHAALKVLRKRKGLEVVSLEAATEADGETQEIPHPEYIADWRETPEVLAQRHETGLLIEESLATLDEKLRVVFLLRDVEGLSVRETAEALGLTEVNVKVRLLRARLQLRERLTRLFGDPSTRIEKPRHHHD